MYPRLGPQSGSYEPGWGDGHSGFWTRGKSGSKIITVDPRLSETAAISDLWLQIRPGTDAALALSMINVIIAENLYDQDFVSSWTVGFDQLRERVGELHSPMGGADNLDSGGKNRPGCQDVCHLQSPLVWNGEWHSSRLPTVCKISALYLSSPL